MAMMRKRRLVRVHTTDQAGSRTVEGFLVGRWSGHYVLTRAKLLDDGGTAVQLAGDVEIPTRNVLLIQRMGAQ